MNDYTYQDLLRMQEEAKARVLEMRRRSRFLAEDFTGGESNAECGIRNAELQHGKDMRATDRGKEPRRNGFPPDHASAIRMPVELPERGEARAESEERRRELGQQPDAAERAVPAGAKNAARGSVGLPAALRNVFGSLGEEETEKMFILALCLLLSLENGDEGLMLALMYLIV